ncbi:MAG TPA: polysaccharide pyruvyl transferase family protein [Pirellulaceae bacterium]|nr:polysaccharide pyruvyl transferase family protein [Pirellulaceae bacterium]
MKLLYDIHKENKPAFSNFGDELNLWIWPALMPELLDDNDSVVFVGIGTVLDDSLPTQPTKVVFGAGNGYRPVPVVDDRFRFYCVRGPLTAEALRLPAEMAITDPAVLVRTLVTERSQAQKGIVLMGHHTSATCSDWSFACDELGFSYVHPLWPFKRVIDAIRGAELVVTEAMHGAIVADALRVPWIPVITSASECRFKWNDWTRSVGLEYDPIILPALWDGGSPPKTGIARLRRWVKRRSFLRRLAPARLWSRAKLSSDSVIGAHTSRLLEKLEKLKHDAAREGWGRKESHCSAAAGLV